MVDIEALKEAISESGKSMTRIANEAGMIRETLYNRLNGIGEFTASEIVGLSKALNFTKKKRDSIFFKKS